MPVFIKVTFVYTDRYEEEREQVCYINPEYIKAITSLPDDEDTTVIRFIFDNQHVTVRESIDEIGQKINEAEQRANPTEHPLGYAIMLDALNKVKDEITQKIEGVE